MLTNLLFFSKSGKIGRIVKLGGVKCALPHN
jgi:hypothetical protein